MIKSNLGMVEVTGLKPVVMAEFEKLLEVLRRELGEEFYNMVLQDANNSKQFGEEPEEKKEDFKPYLLCVSANAKSFHGRIGDETNVFDIYGNRLRVGDTVHLYPAHGGTRLRFRNELVIVKDNDSEFVMGLKGSKFEHGVSDDNVGFVIIRNRRYEDIDDGEIFGNIKYIKSEMEDK